MEKSTGIILGVLIGVPLLLCAIGGSIFGYAVYKASKTVETTYEDAKTEYNKEKDSLKDDLDDMNFDMDTAYDDYDYDAGVRDRDYDNANAGELDYTDMPGETICDATLCKDIWEGISAVSAGLHPKCDTQELQDTKMLEPVHDANGTEVWKEQWVVDSCGEKDTYDVAYTLDSDGTGTTYVITLEELR